MPPLRCGTLAPPSQLLNTNACSPTQHHCRFTAFLTA